MSLPCGACSDEAPQSRVGGWIQTYTGKQLWPLDPRPSEIDIRDIARGLSMETRYGGQHHLPFYSVAEHSVLVSYVVPQEYAFVGLMHDAPEGLGLKDIPQPVKRFLPGYAEIEGRMWRAICQRFGMPYDIPRAVKDADIAVLLAEQPICHPNPPADWGILGVAADVRPVGLNPWEAEEQFMRRFKELRSTALQETSR